MARHFCERWNFVKNEKAKNNEAIPYLQPPLGGFAGNQHQRFEIPTEDEPAWQRRRYRHGTRGVTGTCRAQVVRSSADWSLGINLEVSITCEWGNSCKPGPTHPLFTLHVTLILALYSKRLYRSYLGC